jgi:CHAD domain-containing protein
MTAKRPAPTPAAIRALVVERLDGLEAELARAERSVSAGAVHKTRVAARGLRSVLSTLGPLLTPALLARARRDLRNVGVELETIRAADVRPDLLDRLAAHPGALAPGAHRQLLQALELARAEARRRFRKHARSIAYQERLDRLDHTLRSPRLVARRGDLGRDILKQVRKRWKRLKKSLQAGHADPESLHELRLAVKHARYASEALLPLLGIDPLLHTRRLKQLQGCLGEHHDAAEARAWLAGLGEPLAPVLLGRLERPIARVMAGRERQLERLCRGFAMPRLERPARSLSQARPRPAVRSTRS